MAYSKVFENIFLYFERKGKKNNKGQKSILFKIQVRQKRNLMR